MLVKRDRCSWCATVIVEVGPFRCFTENQVRLAAAGVVTLERIGPVQQDDHVGVLFQAIPIHAGRRPSGAYPFAVPDHGSAD